MHKVRVANCDDKGARPFSLLQGLDFVRYEENSVIENARKLHEGDLDVALIPSVDFALHGGYVGLNFGLGQYDFSDRIILYARQDLHRLHTIYLPEHAGSYGMLLKLLLAEKWMVTPRLVRTSHPMMPCELKENEGVLVMYEEPGRPHEPGCAVVEDIIAAWHEWTGLPFVSLIWTARPQALSLPQSRLFNEIFHVSDGAQKSAIAKAAKSYALPLEQFNEYVPDPQVRFYLNEDMVEGLNFFFELCAKKNLLPVTRYSYTTYAPFEKKAKAAPRERAIEELLQESIHGQRLSIKDGIRLASEASPADLGLAADLMRRRLFTDRSINYAYSLDAQTLAQGDDLWRELERAVDCGLAAVVLLPERGKDLQWHEQVLHELKTRLKVSVEGIGVPRILELAADSGLAAKDVASRLVTAGLDAVPSWGGEMLIEARMRREGRGFTAREWMSAVKWLQSLGARSSCAMRVAPQDTWETRLAHLQHLRSLQDLTSGFRYFCTVADPEWEGPASAEAKLRAVSIARLFLDNVPSIHEEYLQPFDSPAALCLWCGVNGVRLDMSGGKETEMRETLTMLRSLRDGGMDFHPRSFEEPFTRGVH